MRKQNCTAYLIEQDDNLSCKIIESEEYTKAVVSLIVFFISYLQKKFIRHTVFYTNYFRKVNVLQKVKKKKKSNKITLFEFNKLFIIFEEKNNPNPSYDTANLTKTHLHILVLIFIFRR